MSFDMMVFEPSAAPHDRASFMNWYAKQAEWSEDHSYDDPQVASPALQRWFAEMIQFFPPINGPLSSPDAEGPEVTDHCIGQNVIYSAFSWSLADEAHAKMRELAIKHEVGFFHASDDPGEILIPGIGPLPSAEKKWWKFW
ncbi:hypothetical protein [Thermomonas carbonis]|uniref:Uncharacterized protein n=1 Tax=Thermomonas carbonis TaxID=1463158 RepID=A0A7G9SNM5_9GAMM|nr:hypothetical protein [Thermomonas carbonis]QNN69450.1 hypothetical protein H9L16_12295 [Thermomonas carbonis]GHC13312.1 hypothetical protein GCM10010080_30950 [Thermomonas carbonis]